jgi:uncharacterized membrane protein
MVGTKLRRLAVGAAAVTLIALISLVPVSANAAPASWRMLDLRTGDTSVAVAINDRGHVAVTRGDGEALLWRNGRITDLGAFTPTDVNNRDEVVGYRSDETGTWAVLWRHGVRVDLETPPGGHSVALGINDRTEVAGWTTANADAPTRASVWRHRVPTTIGGDYSVATDVDDRGQVVGSAELDQVAVRWWHGTETRLSSRPSQATAINRFGTAVGDLFDTGGGFVWQRGGFIELPPRPGEFPYTQPAGINGHTQVVGTSAEGAFVWERGRLTILPHKSIAAAASDINERGVIAGSNPSTPDGLRPHAVIWFRGH